MMETYQAYIISLLYYITEIPGLEEGQSSININGCILIFTEYNSTLHYKNCGIFLINTFGLFNSLVISLIEDSLEIPLTNAPNSSKESKAFYMPGILYHLRKELFPHKGI